MTDPGGPPQPLYHRRFGNGPRQVLALHCSLAHSGAWRGLASALSDEIQMTAPDMLSHGSSPDWDGAGDIQDRMVEAILPFLTGEMDLVGHSFGATVMLRLAVEHPDRVRSLTLIEPVFFAVAKKVAADKVEQVAAASAPAWAALNSGNPEQAARLFNRLWGSGGPRWADLPEKTRAAMTRAIPFVPATDPALFVDRAGLLTPGRLEQVSMPTLLLRGSQTQPIIPIINDELARRIPNAETGVIEGASHMAPISHPAETATHLRAFFQLIPA